MPTLPLVYAPNPIFQKHATPVTEVDDGIRTLVSDMFDTLYAENGVGIGANMVGILTRIIVVDLQTNGSRDPHAFINPEIITRSQETQKFTEASLSYPGISAEITRPKEIELEFLSLEGQKQTLKADGFFATVIQHEMDYLDGRVYLDYLTPMKRNVLLKKMKKHLKQEQLST
jgi:peptide deformylase